MRVLFDANVLVSAALKRSSPPAMVVGICANRTWPMFLSNKCLEEVERILGKKFGWSTGEVDEAINEIKLEMEVLEPLPALEWPNLGDPDDGHLFDAAVYAKIDILISGDKLVRNYKPKGLELVVLSPREFFEQFA